MGSLLETSSRDDALQSTTGPGSPWCQPQARNDHRLHNSYRRCHNGYHLRGEFHGSYHHRRAQDKTNYERRQPPNFYGNGYHYQSLRPFPMNILEGPLPTPPPPFSVNPWPFMNHMDYMPCEQVLKILNCFLNALNFIFWSVRIILTIICRYASSILLSSSPTANMVSIYSSSTTSTSVPNSLILLTRCSSYRRYKIVHQFHHFFR